MGLQKLTTLDFEKKLDQLRASIEKIRSDATSRGQVSRIEELKFELEAQTAEVYAKLSPWQRVQLARHPDRPHTLDYIDTLFTNFIELHGDRYYGDDQAVVGGPAKLGTHRVMVIGHQKGRDTQENVRRNFGMASPEGFRKARRLMQLAEKFKLPLITFLDIPGASPVLEAEERGQAWAIAENLMEMAGLKTPFITTVIGEGGSGGALALGMADRVLMQEYSVYSVASPEGAASIVWRDHKFAPRAAAALKLTPSDLLELGVIDRIIAEPTGAAHRNYLGASRLLEEALIEELDSLCSQPIEKLIHDRTAKFRSIGTPQSASSSLSDDSVVS